MARSEVEKKATVIPSVAEESDTAFITVWQDYLINTKNWNLWSNQEAGLFRFLGYARNDGALGGVPFQFPSNGTPEYSYKL